jgi:hypothetical protein
MSTFDQLSRVITAAVAALFVSTISISAAVGPGQTSPIVYAELVGQSANG